MDVLGEGVMKHVACRVTVDGSLPEASPVEAPLIRISHIIHTLEVRYIRIDCIGPCYSTKSMQISKVASLVASLERK